MSSTSESVGPKKSPSNAATVNIEVVEPRAPDANSRAGYGSVEDGRSVDVSEVEDRSEVTKIKMSSIVSGLYAYAVFC